ncbi:MAG: PGPGW domain-containing protein [bacterium]
MFSKLQINLKKFYHYPPGHRFQCLYESRHGSKRSFFRRISFILTGIVFIPVGVIFWFIPGSGWLIIFTGLAFLSGESKAVARLLDILEQKVRKLIKLYTSKK